MKTYQVHVDYESFIYGVEANSPEEAEEKALKITSSETPRVCNTIVEVEEE